MTARRVSKERADYIACVQSAHEYFGSAARLWRTRSAAPGDKGLVHIGALFAGGRRSAVSAPTWGAALAHFFAVTRVGVSRSRGRR